MKLYYLLGYHIPSVNWRFLFKGSRQRIALELGRGDRNWKTMGGRFRYEGHSIEDRITDNIRRETRGDYSTFPKVRIPLIHGQFWT